MNDTQLQTDTQTVEPPNALATCRSCGQPISERGTRAYVEWCASMRRLFLLKRVQPEECHQNCFIAALAVGTALAPDGSGNSERPRPPRVVVSRPRQHTKPARAAMTSRSR